MNLARYRRRIQSERTRQHTEALRALVGELAHDCVGGSFECDVPALRRQVDPVRTSQEDRQLLLDVVGGDVHVTLPSAYRVCAPDGVSAPGTTGATPCFDHFSRIRQLAARGCPEIR